MNDKTLAVDSELEGEIFPDDEEMEDELVEDEGMEEELMEDGLVEDEEIEEELIEDEEIEEDEIEEIGEDDEEIEESEEELLRKLCGEELGGEEQRHLARHSSFACSGILGLLRRGWGLFQGFLSARWAKYPGGRLVWGMVFYWQ